MEVKKEPQGNCSLYFYKQNGIFIGADKTALQDNQDGRYLALTTGNLIPEVKGEGDADEIIIVRKKKGGNTLSTHVYTVSFPPPDYKEFKTVPVSLEINNTLSRRFLNQENLNPDTFAGITGVRDNATLYKNKIRPRDRILLLNRNLANKSLTFSIKNPGRKDISRKFPDSSGETAGLIPMAALDINYDRKDEIALWRKSKSDIYIDFYQISENSVSHADLQKLLIKNPRATSHNLIGFRQVVMVNAPSP